MVKVWEQGYLLAPPGSAEINEERDPPPPPNCCGNGSNMPFVSSSNVYVTLWRVKEIILKSHNHGPAHSSPVLNFMAHQCSQLASMGFDTPHQSIDHTGVY